MEFQNQIADLMERMIVEYTKAWGEEEDLSFFRLTYPPFINEQHLLHSAIQEAEDLEIPAQRAEKIMVSEDSLNL